MLKNTWSLLDPEQFDKQGKAQVICFPWHYYRVRLLWHCFRDPLVPSSGYLSENFCQGLATLISESPPRTLLILHLHYVFLRNRIIN
jgi:hypothetical protein